MGKTSKWPVSLKRICTRTRFLENLGITNIKLSGWKDSTLSYSNETKCAIWEQLHLNFYTQYSYNKWHSTSELCPLCQKCPDDIFHIILHCDFTNSIWTELQPILRRFLNKDVDDQEKALGLVDIKSSPGILLRNWVTFKVREQIMKSEQKAHYSGCPSMDSFKAQFNRSMADDTKRVLHRFYNEGAFSKIDELVAFNGVLCRKVSEDNYTINHIFWPRLPLYFPH